MERKRFSVLFFIKRSKLLKNGEAPVRVRVTYDRLYVELQLKRSVKVPLWSQEKEKSTGKDRNILPFFACREKTKIPISLGNQDFTVFCFSSKWCHQQPKIGLYSTISQ